MGNTHPASSNYHPTHIKQKWRGYFFHSFLALELTWSLFMWGDWTVSAQSVYSFCKVRSISCKWAEYWLRTKVWSIRLRCSMVIPFWMSSSERSSKKSWLTTPTKASYVLKWKKIALVKSQHNCFFPVLNFGEQKLDEKQKEISFITPKLPVPQLGFFFQMNSPLGNFTWNSILRSLVVPKRQGSISRSKCWVMEDKYQSPRKKERTPVVLFQEQTLFSGPKWNKSIVKGPKNTAQANQTWNAAVYIDWGNICNSLGCGAFTRLYSSLGVWMP